jgi:hypothetical protein
MAIYKFPGSAIQSNTITITQIQTTAVASIVTQAVPRVTSLIYPGDDTAGNTVGGQTVYINGSGFETNNAIYINGNAVPSKSFISASNLSFTTPALSAGIYPVYVINTDSGATAIFVPGYIASAEPAWVTSAGSLNASQDEATAWSYSLSATGDAPITYALASGSTLPSGISLAANGVVSGTLSSPPGTETTYTFSVVATDAENQESTRQFTVTTSSGEGVLFANNVLLIHADGTNNKNNHTFLDSSNNNFTITRNGNATQGSFSPFSQTGWSGYFDGTGDQLAVNSMTFSANAVTVEAWVYFTADSFGSFHDIFIINSVGMLLDSGRLRFYGFSATTASATITRNKWVHVAVVKESNNTLKGYYDGVECFSTTSSTVWQPSNQTGYIGSWSSGSTEFFPGYISNLRLSNVARYTSNFTPPTSPFSSDANTILLSCQSNRFIDNSNNNFAITRNGDTSIQAFAPFAPTAAYSTADVGGSGYFDGNGDYLSLPSSQTNLQPESGNFTLEFWYYTSVTPSGYINLFSYGAGGNALRLFLYTTNSLTVWTGSSLLITANNVHVANAWNHVAIVRSGTTLTIYVNGVNVGTNNNNSTNYVGNLNIAFEDGQASLTGYISNFRLIKGTAVYTSAFTPPTAPLTNIANTSLLCNFTNAGIFDQTAKTVLETVGDAKVSTAQYKYGTGSIAFDGTGDFLTVPASPLWIMSSDWTMEAWIYPTSVTGVRVLIDTRNRLQVTSPVMYINGTSLVIDTGGAAVVSAGTITINTWQHVAATRSGNSWRLFINGTQVGSTGTNSTAYSVGYGCCIGSSYSNEAYVGYIDDLRITKGYARYTSNFTAPTSALKDK